MPPRKRSTDPHPARLRQVEPWSTGPVTRQNTGGILLLGSLLAAALWLFWGSCLLLGLLLDHRSLLAATLRLVSGLTLIQIIGCLALGSFWSRLGRFLGGSGRLGRTATSLGWLSLSDCILLSSSFSTRSSLGLGVGLCSRLSSLLVGRLIRRGLFGTSASLCLGGLFFRLIVGLIGFVNLLVVGKLLGLGARSLLDLFGRFGILVVFTSSSTILLGLILGLLARVLDILLACQSKSQQIMRSCA